MNRAELDILIARYFDGDTTVVEERTLLRELLNAGSLWPEAREALAVMGYGHMADRGKDSSGRNAADGRRPVVRNLWAAASVAAVALLLSWMSLRFDTGRHTECFAFVDGHKVNDNEMVMRIMSAQLGEMSQASGELADAVTEDWKELGEALKVD